MQGEDCSMTCHMVEVENNLGRSLVIDLETESDNKFRQVDHRSIESIIFKNVKYVLKKGGKISVTLTRASPTVKQNGILQNLPSATSLRARATTRPILTLMKMWSVASRRIPMTGVSLSAKQSLKEKCTVPLCTRQKSLYLSRSLRQSW